MLCIALLRSIEISSIQVRCMEGEVGSIMDELRVVLNLVINDGLSIQKRDIITFYLIAKFDYLFAPGARSCRKSLQFTLYMYICNS